MATMDKSNTDGRSVIAQQGIAPDNIVTTSPVVSESEATPPSAPSTPVKGNSQSSSDTMSTSSTASTPTAAASTNVSTPQAAKSSPMSPTASGSGTPRAHTPRFPVRIGISWRKGEKLEAMDFSRTWYPSKIVDIDAAAKHVLIHFEGWNQRYDEWVGMDSEKLRPVTRHSERKDKGSRKRRIHPHPIYRAGEQVMAKWTDCKRYPAKINRQMEGGAYEVVFYDGVSRLIQPMNIRPMPEEMKNNKQLSTKVPPSPRPKLSFKSIKLTLPESVRKRTEGMKSKSKLSTMSKMMSQKMKKRSPQKLSPGLGSPPKTDMAGEDNIILRQRNVTDTSPPGEASTAPSETSGVTKARISPLKMKRFKKSGLQHKAKSPSTPQTDVGMVAETAAATPSSDVSLASATPSSSTTIPAVIPSSVVLKDVGLAVSADTQQITTAEGQTLDAPTTIQAPTNVQGKAKGLGLRRGKKKNFADPFHPPKRRRTKSKSCVEGDKPVGFMKRPPLLGTGEKAKSLDMGSGLATPPANNPLPMQIFIPSKAFIVEEDHNPYKCPHEGCNKDFRKENLLAYHIKYYHTEPEAQSSHTTTSSATSDMPGATVTSPLVPPSVIQSPGGTPVSRKRRKKTNSVCSTDSDVSISSKGKSSSKRQRHDSEISVTTASPDVTGRDMWSDMKASRISQDSTAEESVAADTEDDDMETDIVNCICGQRETNGLMIQCEVCMCWQHFACVDTKNSGVPPANHICLVCENTPEIRDSCRHMSDMGWERRGELPSFPFVAESCGEHLRSIACECNDLAAALHRMKSALHSTRRQIKISKEETDPEFQLWQTDWDNWTKPEEDLTLTPRSVDPDPSPTPSTFLFPPAPHLNTAITTSGITPSATSPSHMLADHSSSLSSSSSSSLPHSSLTTSASSGQPTTDMTRTQTPLSTTITTMEVSLTPESPSVTSQPPTASSEEFPSSNITPPSGSSHLSFQPKTPTTERQASLSSFQGRGGDLVKDLFPGPGGDADRPSKDVTGKENSTSESQVNNVQRKDTTNPSLSTNINTVQTESTSEQTGHGKDSQNVDLSANLPVSTNEQADLKEPSSLSQVYKQRENVTSSASSISTLSTPLLQEGGSDSKKQDTVSGGQKQGADSGVHEASQREDPSKSVPASQAGGVHATKNLTTLYVDVNGGQGHTGGYNDDDQDNDTDTAEESADPYRNCEHNLLVHVTKVHSDIEKQLEVLEQRITELENSEHTNPTIQLSEDNVLNDLPALKKSLGKLSRNLVKVERLCTYH